MLIKIFQLKEHYIFSNLRSKLNFFCISFLISKEEKSGLLKTVLYRLFSFKVVYFLVIVIALGKDFHLRIFKRNFKIKIINLIKYVLIYKNRASKMKFFGTKKFFT